MEEKVLSILEYLCEDSIVRENLDVDLFESGLMDSLSYVEMLVSLEDSFSITISPSEISREDTNTPRKIISIIENKLNNK